MKSVVQVSSCLVPYNFWARVPLVGQISVLRSERSVQLCNTCSVFCGARPQAQRSFSPIFNLLNIWCRSRLCPVRNLNIVVCCFLDNHRTGSLALYEKLFSRTQFRPGTKRTRTRDHLMPKPTTRPQRHYIYP